MDARIKEAVRYLGYGKTAADEKTLLMIQESFEEIEGISKPQCVYQIFELYIPEKDELKICNMHIKSKSLYRNLIGCEKVILFGATMGIEVDRKLRIYEVKNIAKAVVLQACAAVLLEEYCDAMQEQLALEHEKERLYIRPRFSPGYGDFSISHQKEVLQLLDAPKRIGLTMTDGCMLTPTKSITALIGISRTKERGNKDVIS